ncbi:exosome ribonuclease PH [Babesia caballi]|uniref:Ribosomal RNA-processing protein 42 n=1 Tax=Babesia caballi TaxID=5871 RepID=A0AAV4LSC7_BABCB|nr:exosome ribonuclease PH [Babesia caballi]
MAAWTMQTTPSRPHYPHTVQFAVSPPAKDAPDEGNVEIALVSPFTLEDQDVSQKREERLEHLLEALQFQRHRFDRRLLCILPGQFAWTVRFHSTVVQRGGATVDAASIAMIAALRTAQIPNVQVVMRDQLELARRGANVRVRLAEGYNLDVQRLVQQMPLCVTVAQIAGCHVWAVTLEEAACADGFLTIAVAPDARCLGLRATGSCFPLPAIATLVARACEVGLLQHQQLARAL